MEKVWTERKEAQAQAVAAIQEREQKRYELPTKWMEMAKNTGDAKSLAWLAACHLLHAEKVNIHRTVQHVLGGEVSSTMTWEASRKKALEFGSSALSRCQEDQGKLFCRSLIARAKALTSPTTPVTESKGMSSAVGLMAHYEYLPEELAILSGGQNLEDLSQLVATINGSAWLAGFGGIREFSKTQAGE
jgi:hypothetical protein